MITGKDKKMFADMLHLNQEQARIIKKQTDEIIALTKMLKEAIACHSQK